MSVITAAVFLTITAAEAAGTRPAVACPPRTAYSTELYEGRLHSAWCVRSDGLKEGPFVSFYANGQKVVEMAYREGAVHGRASYFLNDGTMHLWVEWREGEAIEEWRNPVMDTLSRERLRELGAGECGGVVHIDCSADDKNPLCRPPPPPPVHTLRHQNRRRRAVGARTEGSRPFGRFAAGERHGTWRTWYPSGELATEAEYSGGQLSRQYKSWHKNGQLESSGEFLSGRRIRTWRFWDASGASLPDRQFRDPFPGLP